MLTAGCGGLTMAKREFVDGAGYISDDSSFCGTYIAYVPAFSR